jgi:hypothetical protein
MLATWYGQCPFCGHRDVSTLDHCLPKANHPALAVTPINLVPCCKDCNHKKGNFSATSKNDQFLNPYYDDICGDAWLFADIVQTSPPGATYSVRAPSNWSVETSARVRNHFVRLELEKLYASQASRELQNVRHALGRVYEAAGPDAVRDDLHRRYEGYSANSVNSWQCALFASAMSNPWYCNGGFRA